MPKVKTTKNRMRTVSNAASHLLNQPKMDPLFALLLAAIVHVLETRVKGLSTLLTRAQDDFSEKDGNGNKIPAKDEDGKKTGGFRIDPDRVEEYNDHVEMILGTVVGFKCPSVKLSSLVEAWEQSVNTGDSDDDPERLVEIPGWVTSAFFQAGLLELDIKSGDLEFLNILDDDDEDDEELGDDAVADRPMTPKRKEQEETDEKARVAGKTKSGKAGEKD